MAGDAELDPLRQVFEQMKPLVDTITALGFTIETRDPYVKSHSQAVSRLAAQIAMQMGLSEPIRDADDRWVLASAVSGKADVLVTGDSDLLEMVSRAPLPIVDPRGFWEMVRGLLYSNDGALC